MWSVNMTGKTKGWPANSPISLDIVCWLPIISSPVKGCLALQIFSQEQTSSEMSSCCSCYVFSQLFAYFFLVKWVKCFTILYSLPKQLDNLISRSSQLTVQFSGNYVTQLTKFFLYCQTEISQSKMEKYFEWIILSV